MLEVKNLNYSFGDGTNERVIFDDVNISFEKGKMYALLGASGSGKSTFLSIIGGRTSDYKGDVYYEDKNIKEIGLTQYRRKYASTIFQNYNLIPYINSIDNIKIGLDISANVNNIDSDDINKLLTEIGITEEERKRKVSTLSGGEQQRVAIARSLLMDMPLILADEPTGNLDKNTSVGIVMLLKKLAEESDKCIIMATHNEKLAKITDEILDIDQQQHKIIKRKKIYLID